MCVRECACALLECLRSQDRSLRTTGLARVETRLAVVFIPRRFFPSKVGGRPAWRGTPSDPGRDLETVLVGFWDRPRDRREHAKEHRRFGLDVRVTEFPMISDVGGEQRSCLIRLIPEKLPVEEQLKCLRPGLAWPLLQCDELDPTLCWLVETVSPHCSRLQGGRQLDW